jgi:hypothetical protein
VLEAENVRRQPTIEYGTEVTAQLFLKNDVFSPARVVVKREGSKSKIPLWYIRSSSSS